MVASNLVATCEGLIYAHKAGLDLDKMKNLLRHGGAGSFTLSYFGPKILRHDYAPGGEVGYFVKDLGIAL